MNQSIEKCSPYINSIFEYDTEISNYSEDWKNFYNEIVDGAMIGTMFLKKT